MYSVYKNNYVIGLLSALVVGLFLIIDARRKKEAVDTGNLMKTTVTIFAVVSLVVYLSRYLHIFNKQLGGFSDLDVDVDTGLPHF